LGSSSGKRKEVPALIDMETVRVITRGDVFKKRSQKGAGKKKGGKQTIGPLLSQSAGLVFGRKKG